MCFFSFKNIFLKNNKDLENFDKISFFSLEGKIFKCRVVDVYDGDTLTVIFKYKKEWNKWKIRMLGYDTPEIRQPRDNPLREEKKFRAVIAKEYLIDLLNQKGKKLYIKCGKFDKYGRLLGELFYSKSDITRGKSINKTMINSQYAVPYDGKCKKK